MAHEVDSMAFAHAVPWHGLGSQVDPAASIEVWRRAAGLEWTVKENEVLHNYKGRAYVIPRRTALVRSDNGHVFDVVSDRFRPVQNDKIIDFFRRFCAAGGAQMETLGALRRGAVVWGLANLQNGFIMRNGQAIKSYLLLQTRHETGYATTAKLTPVVVVCANTLAMALRANNGQEQGRFPHTAEFNPEAAAATCAIARDNMAQFQSDAEALSALRLSDDDARAVLAAAYKQPGYDPDDEQQAKRLSVQVERIMEAALRGAGGDVNAGTAWGLLQGVTYHHNHLARDVGHGGRLASAFDGIANKAMTKVMADLMAMTA